MDRNNFEPFNFEYLMVKTIVFVVNRKWKLISANHCPGLINYNFLVIMS
jgi:hypothetical protein